MQSIFSRHGIPQDIFSDNGPQYSSLEYARFAAEYGFTHTTSSPNFSQSNGEAERAVQTMKHFLRKNDNPHMALMIYHSTTLHNGYSPSGLLMNRRIHTTLRSLPILIINSQLQPSVPDYTVIREKEDKMRST